MQAQLKESLRGWRSLPRTERFHVRMAAVLVGWFIQFILGVSAICIARWPEYALLVLDVMESDGSKSVSSAMRPQWPYAALAGLFVIWGAFRCACMAKKRGVGSLLVYWLGAEALTFAFWLDAAVPKHRFVEFILAGVLTFIGGALALQYSVWKRSSAST